MFACITVLAGLTVWGKQRMFSFPCDLTHGMFPLQKIVALQSLFPPGGRLSQLSVTSETFQLNNNNNFL